MATICCVVASSWLTEATRYKHHNFWMKPKFFATAYAIDSSAPTIYWFSNKSSWFVFFFKWGYRFIQHLIDRV